MMKSNKAVLFGFLIFNLLSTIVLIEFTRSVEASPGLTTTSLTIGGTQSIDVDTGQVGSSSPETDLWWEQVTSTDRFLVPANGAELANLGIVDFDSVVDCSAYILSTDPINGSVDNNTIPEGTVLVVRTNIGNYAKMRIDGYGYDLDVTIVYQDDGSPIVSWAARVYGVEMLWNNPMSVNDVAVSKDSNYVAAVNGSGIYYFTSNSSNPKWWHLSPDGILSVAISADGEYVVAGGTAGRLYYFNDSRASIDQRLSPTWTSQQLGGWIEKGTLDMSDDGDYVAVGGTGVSLYYFAGCGGRSSSSETPTWRNDFNWDIDDFNAVRISSDGRYVAAGAVDWPTYIVMFYKAANSAPYPTGPSWYSDSSIGNTVLGLELSDDGYAVAAIDSNRLYYWANATNLIGDPTATWTSANSLLNLWSVDMSADGSDVVAGSLPFTSLHFWAEARSRHGTQTETWVKSENANMYDVTISEDGGIIAASVQVWENATYYPKAYFFKSVGNMIGEFDLPGAIPSFVVSMSRNGRIVAMGSSGSSLYVFEVLEDSSPPVIEDVYQEPANDAVTSDDEVMVFANVSDNQTGVKQVILSYTIDNETWFIRNMTNLERNLWNATIPSFPYCTNVAYVVMAENFVNNKITTLEMEYECQYHVIIEYPSAMVPSLFMFFTLIAVVLAKRMRALNQV